MVSKDEEQVRWCRTPLEIHDDQVYSLLLRLKMSHEYGRGWKYVRIADKDAQVSAMPDIVRRPIVPSIPPNVGKSKGSRDRKSGKKRGKAAGRGLKDPDEKLL